MSARSPRILIVLAALLLAATAISAQQLTVSHFFGSTGGFSYADGNGTSARIGAYGIVRAPDGSVFFSNGNAIRKISPAGEVGLYAGHPDEFARVNGDRFSARFKYTRGLALDSAGNLYVADAGNFEIRKITPSGTVSTFGVTIGTPTAIAVDANGIVYVTTERHTILKYLPSGARSILAGGDGIAGSADGSGTAARFNFPAQIVADNANGWLFVADSVNNTIRKVTFGGAVTTFAGLAGQQGNTDGTGSAARFTYPHGITIGTAGDLYVNQNFCIRKITPAAVVTTVAGPGYGYRDGPAASTRMRAMMDMTYDPSSDSVLFVDYENYCIRRLSLPAATVTTYAGLGVLEDIVDGSGTSVQTWAGAMTAGPDGYVYFVDGSTIRRFDAAGNVTTYAGSPSVQGTVDGPRLSARFNGPTQIAFDPSGTMFVVDSYEYVIRRIGTDGIVSTFAGTPGSRGWWDGTGPTATFNSPYGIVSDSAGNLFVSDWTTIRKITPAAVVTTVAGVANQFGSVNGNGAAARFNGLSELRIDAANNIYAADNTVIRRITPAFDVTTEFCCRQGGGGIELDAAGNLYISDPAGYIHKKAPNGTVEVILDSDFGARDGTSPDVAVAQDNWLAIAHGGRLYIGEPKNGRVRRLYPTLPDVAAIDATTGQIGQTRTLSVSGSASTEWTWTILRRPAGSTVQVSGASSSNATFTPDVPGPYRIQLFARNANQARYSYVELTAACVPPPAPTITLTQGTNPNCAGTTVGLRASDGYVKYVWSNGSVGQTLFINPSSTTSYTVVGYSEAICASGPSAPWTQQVTQPITSASITPSTPASVCPGTSGPTLTINFSGGGVNNSHTWYYSTTPGTQSFFIPGQTAATYTLNASHFPGPGTYYVSSRSTSSCNSGGGTVRSSNDVTVTVNSAATATITPSGPTTFCQGGSVTLTANSGASYLWSTGATTQSIVVSASGSYHVTVASASGCSATSTPASVTVNPAPPVPSITPSGPTTFCEGGSVTLTAPAGFTYAWSNGATAQSINVTTAGSYSVTVTNASGCSTTSAPTAVTVNANPSTPSITPSGATTFCEGGSVTLSAPAGFTYSWSNGATTQSINVTAGGSYSVTVTNASGCSAASAPTTVTVHPAPSTPSITPSGPTTFCEGGSVTLTAPAGFTYNWSNGATTQSINVTNSGSYSVTVTNGNGCSTASAPITVTVHPAATTPSITPSGATTFCEGGSVTLTASSGSAYLWSTGATTQSINVTASGSYSVTVTNANGCNATSAPTAVTVNPAPSTPSIAPSGPTSFCEGGSVTLTAPAGFTYNWSTGATTQSIVVAASGSYSVTVTNGNGCSAASAPATVTVHPAATTPAITPSGATTFCQGGSVTLTASSGSAYLWSTGATTQSIDATASGSYSVTVTNANGCSATSAATSVTVTPAPATPAITPSGPTSFCEGGSVTLTASSAAAYLWSTGATTQSIVVTASGSYSVTVTDANGCGATSWPTAVNVHTLPAAEITASSTTLCEVGSVTLTASAGASWLWSNGATTQSIQVSEPGSYSVTVSDGICSNTSAPVTIDRESTAVSIVGNDPTLCPGQTVSATATVDGTAVSYQWYGFGGQPIEGATGPSVSFTVTQTSTSYLFVRITTPAGCVIQSNVFIYNVSQPDATITANGPTTFCEGGAVELSVPDGPGQTYLWSNGATSRAIGVTASGSYSVTVTNANGCSATSEPVTVTVHPAAGPAEITASGPTTFCEGGSVTLTAPAGYTYEWSTGATTQSIAVTATGSYSVTITNANGCSAYSMPVNVTVHTLPSTPAIAASGSTTFCEGGSVTLTAPAGFTYLWSTGATSQSIGVNASGSYSVTVTNAYGCSATSAATSVTVHPNPPAPAVSASGPTTFCQGGSVTLTAPAGFTYLWSTGATTQSIVVTASDNYSVTITNGCSAVSAATVVTVNANPSSPSITPSGPTTFCEGGSVTLTAPAGFTYLWSTGATTQSIVVTASDNYSVTVTNGSGCSAVSAATVIVNAVPAQPSISGPASFCPGTSIALTAPAGYASYLWSNGQTTQSISVNAAGNYTVAVTNAQGCSRTSAVHVVTENAATAITVQPQSFTMPRNSTRTLSVTATGTPNLQYQWYRGFAGDTSSPVVGETGSSYTFTLTKKGTYRYWVRVTSSTCTGSAVNSATATITVN